MRYVVPDWEVRYKAQSWQVQKWCLVKCEKDLKKYRKLKRFSALFMAWSVLWSVFSLVFVFSHDWITCVFVAVLAVCGFLHWQIWKAQTKRIEIVEAVYKRMRELSVVDT